ncbi:MAG TPA: hypothetical protein VG778_01880, partial [Blastocatellia bacterium]|nr:hypothetical protein [Blastocatellia bacterium]
MTSHPYRLFSFILVFFLAAPVVLAQTRRPATPARPFVVFKGQSLADLERRLKSENKTEDLVAGEGLQMRIAVQHSKGEP